MRIANCNAYLHTERLEEFKANTIFAELKNSDAEPLRYVVYSYGYHYPMFIYRAGLGWFENADKYSRTTSKHHGEARPQNVKVMTLLSTAQMKHLAEYGEVK